MHRRLKQERSVRLSVETVNTQDNIAIHHCATSHTQPHAEFTTEPVLFTHVDVDVLSGKKPWPAVDISVVETEPMICIICGVDFKTRSSLHAHLSDHRHLVGKLDKFKRVPLYECKFCSAEINCTTVLRHRCFTKHTGEINDVETLMDNVGSPLACIFCRGRILPSRSHLITHIVFSHSPHRNPLRCVFCNLKFQSDNQLMQEMHAFEHHAPEIILLNRLAYFKQIKSTAGLIVDAKTPFICLYNASRMETPCWIDAIKPRSNDSWEMNNQGRESPTKSHLNEPCLGTFKNLAEFTAHVYCYHSILPHSRDKGRELNASEVRQLDLIKKALPGPCIRDLIGNAFLGPFGKSRFGNLAEANRKSLTLRSGWNSQHLLTKFSCRICLHDFATAENLSRHVNSFHITETAKRIQHLADVGEMVESLDINRLCTECFTMFSSVFKLQVHILVAHGGDLWCNCGICNQQFCENNHCLPAILTVGPAVAVTEDENQNRREFPEELASSAATESASIEKNPPFQEDLDALYAPYEAQILESRGHQAKQIYDWLSNAFNQPATTEIKPFVYEDPNSKKSKRNKIGSRMNPGEDPLHQEGVEIGQRMLDALISRWAHLLQMTNSDIDDEKLQRKIQNEQTFSETREDASEAKPELPLQKSTLSKKLAELFTSIGQRNLAREQEKEFEEKF
ncbi:hypothetical protein Aperf_G00000128370 [Anoplocephala perfoliata]